MIIRLLINRTPLCFLKKLYEVVRSQIYYGKRSENFVFNLLKKNQDAG